LLANLAELRENSAKFHASAKEAFVPGALSRFVIINCSPCWSSLMAINQMLKEDSIDWLKREQLTLARLAGVPTS